MIERSITIDGMAWTVSLAGRVTQYDMDEFSLVYARTDEHGKKIRRVSRFSPQGARNRTGALGELSDGELAEFFKQSQPDWTSPELGYAR
ncbi:MAG TPA: hypothetical protein VGI92_09230 [Gemmatimonadales bacterium]|jgi:hypothetical protein